MDGLLHAGRAVYFPSVRRERETRSAHLESANSRHLNIAMVKFKNKGKRRKGGMDVVDDSGDSKAENYTYAPPAPGVGKKKRIRKLTHKQKLRKEKNIMRGEALLDRQSKKQERDARKLEKKLAAKALW